MEGSSSDQKARLIAVDSNLRDQISRPQALTEKVVAVLTNAEVSTNRGKAIDLNNSFKLSTGVDVHDVFPLRVCRGRLDEIRLQECFYEAFGFLLNFSLDLSWHRGLCRSVNPLLFGAGCLFWHDDPLFVNSWFCRYSHASIMLRSSSLSKPLSSGT